MAKMLLTLPIPVCQTFQNACPSEERGFAPGRAARGIKKDYKAKLKQLENKLENKDKVNTLTVTTKII